MKVKGLVLGIGINDAGYTVEIKETYLVGDKKLRKRVWSCPFYSTWVHMLGRCYDRKFQAVNPTYKDCTVCDEWLRFSNFKAWMETQDWQGKQLDKDLLVSGNKHYSPDTCCFLSSLANRFIEERGASRGEFPIGVNWDKHLGKFLARCSNPFTAKRENLGIFDDPDLAHLRWLSRKLELAKIVAAKENNDIVSRALIERYENYTKD